MEDTPTAEKQGYPALMQPRIAQPKARPFRVVASERHYPLAGWRRCWSRGDPHPFEFEDSGRPCAAPDGDGWRVEVRDATDQEGWLYGTAFERLNDHRKGGRAAKRSTDRCRRRVWVHCVDAGPAPIEDEEPPQDDGTSLFWRVCRATLGRRPLQDYPMDPTAWYRVRKSHERFYEEWLSKSHPDVARAQLIDLAHSFLYCRAACGGVEINQSRRWLDVYTRRRRRRTTASRRRSGAGRRTGSTGRPSRSSCRAACGGARARSPRATGRSAAF